MSFLRGMNTTGNAHSKTNEFNKMINVTVKHINQARTKLEIKAAK